MDTSRLPFFPHRRAGAADASGAETGIQLPSNRRIGSCMTHRPDIVWIDSGMKKDEILETITAHPEYSLFPVCSGTVDSVAGVLSARSFLTAIAGPGWQGLKPLVRKPVYLPETVSILRTLTTLEETGCRMAFIIDEYGGIEGIVTRNGLLGELLSEVAAAPDSDDPDIFRREDGSWLVGGHVRIDELSELIPLPATEGSSHEYYTLAGYLLALNGSIPKTGDVIAAGGWRCEIVDMDGHRIDKVLVSAIPETARTDSADGNA